MRVRQQHRVDRPWIDRKWRPIAQTQRLETLEQAAIDKDPMALVFKQIFGACDRSDRA